MSQSRIRIIRDAWRKVNKEFFGSKLTLPSVGVLTKSKRSDGWFEGFGSRRDKMRIALHADLFSRPHDLLGALIHEMIHQYQHEILGVDPDHGPFFKSLARQAEKAYRLSGSVR